MILIPWCFGVGWSNDVCLSLDYVLTEWEVSFFLVSVTYAVTSVCFPLVYYLLLCIGKAAVIKVEIKCSVSGHCRKTFPLEAIKQSEKIATANTCNTFMQVHMQNIFFKYSLLKDRS